MWLSVFIKVGFWVSFHPCFLDDGRSFIKKKGRNNVTVDDLVHVITPKGRGKSFFLSSLRFSI